jgi:hypothetical protein
MRSKTSKPGPPSAHATPRPIPDNSHSRAARFDDAPTRPLKRCHGCAARSTTRPGDIAPRDAQDLMPWPFVSLAETPCGRPIDFRMGDATIPVEAAHEHGMATIWDADVLIWAASDRGLRTSRLMAATPHEILAFVRSREGRPINDSPPRTLDGLPCGFRSLCPICLGPGLCRD